MEAGEGDLVSRLVGPSLLTCHVHVRGCMPPLPHPHNDTDGVTATGSFTSTIYSLVTHPCFCFYYFQTDGCLGFCLFLNPLFVWIYLYKVWLIVLLREVFRVTLTVSEVATQRFYLCLGTHSCRQRFLYKLYRLLETH